MTNEEILEGNKIIAQFLTTNKDNPDSDEFYLPQHYEDNGDDWVYENDLMFHKSWNWLMPVITKIHKLGYVTVFYGNHCEIIDKDLFTHKYDGEGFNVEYYSESEDKLIDAVWNCVVEFVKWHTSE